MKYFLKSILEFLVDNISCIFKFIAWLIIIALVVYAIYNDNLQSQEQLIKINKVAEDFGNPVKIIEIYAYRVGSKSANYGYPIGCVIENEKGDRLILKNIDQPGVEGDYWNICVKNGEIKLCEFIKTFNE